MLESLGYGPNARAEELAPDATWHGFAKVAPGYAITDPNKLIFEGQTCNYIQMRGANRVDVVYGCNPVR